MIRTLQGLADLASDAIEAAIYALTPNRAVDELWRATTTAAQKAAALASDVVGERAGKITGEAIKRYAPKVESYIRRQLRRLSSAELSLKGHGRG